MSDGQSRAPAKVLSTRIDRPYQPVNPANISQPMQSILASFSGPLPPPSLLAGYEQACPGAADRIIRMAEQEARHRQTTETAIVQAGTAQAGRESADAKRGQVCALVIVIISIAGAIFLATTGHEVTASALGWVQSVPSSPRLSWDEAAARQTVERRN